MVLDTNVVLDWLAFGDRLAMPIGAAIEGGSVHWIACDRMREELWRVCRYPAMGRWNLDGERLLTRFDCWARMHPTPGTPLNRPLCRDPDDQVFVDLAIVGSARWLVTRDRALLEVAAAMRRHGVVVTTPAGWQAGAVERPLD